MIAGEGIILALTEIQPYFLLKFLTPFQLLSSFFHPGRSFSEPDNFVRLCMGARIQENVTLAIKQHAPALVWAPDQIVNIPMFEPIFLSCSRLPITRYASAILVHINNRQVIGMIYLYWKIINPTSE